LLANIVADGRRLGDNSRHPEYASAKAKLAAPLIQIEDIIQATSSALGTLMPLEEK